LALLDSAIVFFAFLMGHSSIVKRTVPQVRARPRRDRGQAHRMDGILRRSAAVPTPPTTITTKATA
jgi:hypothetical protein